MDPSSSTHELFERVKQEHNALRDKLGRIHAVLAGSEIAAAELGTLLREFQTALTVHFSVEETGGFFDEVVAHAPRFADRAGRLWLEHHELLLKSAELCRFAAVGSPSIAWWRELRARCHEFSRQLMHHESEENRLLQTAYQEDIGVDD